jgi:hypothetical protein
MGPRMEGGRGVCVSRTVRENETGMGQKSCINAVKSGREELASPLLKNTQKKALTLWKGFD